MTGDLYVIGLVGQDETGGGITFQQSSKNRRIGRVATHDAMRAELENIADPGDRSCGVGLKRPLLQPFSGVAENDMVDLGLRETSDLYRRVEQDQFFRLYLQRVEVPLALFRETIDREPKHALFFWAQVSDADARKPIKAQLLGGFVADLAMDDLVVATHKERNTKAQGADRRSDLPNMSGIKFADLSGGGSKLFERKIGKLQSG
jgi:hypothetical protein